MSRSQIPPAVAEGDAGAAVMPGQDTLRALWIQFAAVLVAVAGLWSYLAFGSMSRAERSLLAPGALWARTLEHLGLTVAAVAVVLLLALPLGLALTRGRLRRLARPTLVVVGFGEGAPAIGLMVLLACVLGFGARSTIAGLVACAVLPVLRAIVAGPHGVDARHPEGGPEAGTGSRAVRSGGVLHMLPALLLGVRTALVLVVGTASLAAFTGGGGLGVLITAGVERHQPTVTVVGAGLVTLLAVVADWLGRFAEALVRRRHPVPTAEPEVQT